jgi:hypothetical protein
MTCEHNKLSHEWCVLCLRTEVDRLRAVLLWSAGQVCEMDRYHKEHPEGETCHSCVARAALAGKGATP